MYKYACYTMVNQRLIQICVTKKQYKKEKYYKNRERKRCRKESIITEKKCEINLSL